MAPQAATKATLIRLADVKNNRSSWPRSIVSPAQIQSATWGPTRIPMKPDVPRVPTISAILAGGTRREIYVIEAPKIPATLVCIKIRSKKIAGPVDELIRQCANKLNTSMTNDHNQMVLLPSRSMPIPCPNRMSKLPTIPTPTINPNCPSAPPK